MTTPAESRALGGYRLEGVIGSGTSGTVFLGIGPGGGRVAVKVLAPELAADDDFLAEFRAEAAVMQRVAHPNCVGVVELIDAPPVAAIVSELVNGASLRTVLDEHPYLRPERALAVLQGALRGVAHLHDLGLVHRDVKPANILVTTGGVSKLADFGLARPVAELARSAREVLGTPAYMSPEQIRGEPVDHRSDIYACGTVLFEALTGRRFSGTDTAAKGARLHRGEAPPDLHALHPEFHPAVAALLTKALAPRPADRHQSALELLAELETAAAEAYGPDWATRATLAGLTTAAAAALAAALGASGSAGVVPHLAGLLPDMASLDVAGTFVAGPTPPPVGAPSVPPPGAGSSPTSPPSVSPPGGAPLPTAPTSLPPSAQPPASTTPTPLTGQGHPSARRVSMSRRVATASVATKALSVVTVLALLLGIGGVILVFRTDDQRETSVATGGPPPSGTAVPTTVAPANPSDVSPRPGAMSFVASAREAAVPVFANPAAVEPVATLDNPHARFGSPLVFLVKAQADDWLEVYLPTPPNGSTGWIRAGDVAVATNPYYVRVERESARVTVWNLEAIVIQDSVAVGRPEHPTPIGLFFLTALVEDQVRPMNCLADESHSRYFYFTSAFRDYQVCNPGISDMEIVGIGTDDPVVLGTHTSHGAVRTSNDVITQLANSLPLGTPVEVVA